MKDITFPSLTKMSIFEQLRYILLRLRNYYTDDKVSEYTDKMMIEYIKNVDNSWYLKSEFPNLKLELTEYERTLIENSLITDKTVYDNIIIRNELLFVTDIKGNLCNDFLKFSDVCRIEEMGKFILIFPNHELEIGKTRMLQSQLYLKLLLEDKYTEDSLNIDLEVSDNVIKSLKELLNGNHSGYSNKLMTINDIMLFLNIFDYLELDFVG